MRLFISAIILGGLVGCGSSVKDPKEQKTDNDTDVTPVQDEGEAVDCAADADCVPASCCHPSACVHKSEAPENCAEMICTMDCKEGTMDCGKGRCGCKEGTCVVNWAE